MKKKLLSLFAFIFFTANGFSQLVANQPPDIFQCGFEIFDLTVQDPIILNGLDPVDFSVTYFNTEADALDNSSPIVNPTEYVPNGQQEPIFARLSSTSDETFDTTSFLIAYGIDWVPTLNDITECEEYILPTLQVGNYYTDSNGTGTMLSAGDAITTSQIIYIYNQDFGCESESNFLVTISNVFLNSTSTLLGCDTNEDGIAEFNLSSIIPAILQDDQTAEVSFHETMEDAQTGNAPIENLNTYTNTVPNEQIIYIRLQINNCSAIGELILITSSDCTGNSVTGTITYDIDANGCDDNDIAAAGVMVSYTNNDETYYTYTDASGNYVFYNTPDSEIVIEVSNSGNIDYITSPSNYTLTPSGEISGNDFCLEVTNAVNDVSVTLIPATLAIPGFQTTYILAYQNIGTFPSNGTISLEFDDTMMTYDSASPTMGQSSNTLSFTYSNLAPFETQYITINFTVMQPPVVNSDDILTFTTTINTTVDDNLDNNTYVLDQIVVNSFDPNDIRVHEGEYITEEQADDYLHYTIRFQNEGTANATNIRVDTDLDANLDWSTFEPIIGSHDYVTERNGDAVSFIFNGINLPYVDADEAGSHGYISYKIKPIETIALGDVMEATAGIYFDFNEAIITNTASTTVQAPASTTGFTANDFILYPNPASSNVTLRMLNLNGTAIVTVTDVLGKTVLTTQTSNDELNLDISSLNKGMYFITLQAEKQSITKKIVVK
ncbi:MAG: hypothetical protein BM557_11455 [Flavobacterium sp. MedPE-SWcel]|uniref:DUF7619 domain-containing protein n=1 Tax=uncultured Flavobacterium sp. TaxID=165435 RepID=UPI000916D250|nr:T9SS type A sorting domain-containing protein [uncultured Flavobacterium sp.]OIQ15377.1 MAG: hypothetical protein BM557_11455 [Flavobacterium sp. MedPE-SWcel]